MYKNVKKKRRVKKRTEKEMVKERRGIEGVKPKREDRKEAKVVECEKNYVTIRKKKKKGKEGSRKDGAGKETNTRR